MGNGREGGGLSSSSERSRCPVKYTSYIRRRYANTACAGRAWVVMLREEGCAHAFVRTDLCVQLAGTVFSVPARLGTAGRPSLRGQWGRASGAARGILA